MVEAYLHGGPSRSHGQPIINSGARAAEISGFTSVVTMQVYLIRFVVGKGIEYISTPSIHLMGAFAGRVSAPCRRGFHRSRMVHVGAKSAIFCGLGTAASDLREWRCLRALTYTASRDGLDGGNTGRTSHYVLAVLCKRMRITWVCGTMRNLLWILVCQ